MGYHIEYGGVKKVRGLERRTLRLPALTGLFFLLFVFLVTTLWPEGAQLLRETVIPGDPAVAAASFERLKEDLYSGLGMGSSLKLFFSSILRGIGFAAD